MTSYDDDINEPVNPAETDAEARQMVREAFDYVKRACAISKTVRKEVVDVIKRITLGMPPGPVGPEYIFRELFEKPRPR